MVRGRCGQAHRHHANGRRPSREFLVGAVWAGAVEGSAYPPSELLRTRCASRRAGQLLKVHGSSRDVALRGPGEMQAFFRALGRGPDGLLCARTPSSAASPATGTLPVQLDLQHSDAVDPPGLIRDATSSTLNKSSLAVNPRTLSSPARRASQDSSTPAIQLGLPPLLRPAIVLPRRTREDTARRQTERAREQKQKQKQTVKNLDADFQLDGKTLPGSGWATG